MNYCENEPPLNFQTHARREAMPHDVFISYGHLDNSKPNREEEGWVTDFHHSLKKHLGEWLGREALIWRDEERMGVGDILTPSLEAALHQSLTIVCVVSPSYVVSRWCSDELKNFCDNVGKRLGNKSRVYYTVRLPFEPPPDNMLLDDPDILNMQFYETDEHQTPFVLPPKSPEFTKRVNSLAHKISQMLTELRVMQTPQPPIKKTIYLARPTDDLNDDYTDVREDLLRQNYIVIPSPLVLNPSGNEAFKESVKKEMEKCSLAVHLVSKNYGVCPPPKNEGLSYVHLQIRAGAGRDRDPDFSRLIWLPDDVTDKEDFTNEILASASNKVDVFRDRSRENLKTRIKDILEGKPLPLPKRYVYVYCEESDMEAVNDLESILFEKFKCEIISASNIRSQPQDNGSQMDFLKQHKEFLEECKGVLIYWKTPIKFWVQTTVMQFRKVVNPESLGVFFADEREDRKTFHTNEAKIIKNYDELTPFVQKLNLNLGGS